MRMTTETAPITPRGSTDQAGRRRTRRARLALAAGAVALVATDLAVKALAQKELAAGRTVDLGILDLRLGYNSGAAFSLGAGLPSWLVIAVTALITAGVAVFAWRVAIDSTVPMLIGLSGVLAGAVGNLVDRAGDGVVTDYLHTGWWPTFNLADVFITLGAATVLIATLRSETTGVRRS
jgi:signal peptidase II